MSPEDELQGLKQRVNELYRRSDAAHAEGLAANMLLLRLLRAMRRAGNGTLVEEVCTIPQESLPIAPIRSQALGRCKELIDLIRRQKWL